jgi:ABC-type nitrate/sulfonate/bicarbonate transport system substrate-binding protein
LELAASAEYQQALKRLARILGGVQVGSIQLSQIAAISYQALLKIFQKEYQHKNELEKLAVELVLSLPEFRDAKEAVESGDLIIDAKLVNQEEVAAEFLKHIKKAQDRLEDEEEEAEEETRQKISVDEPEEDEETRAEFNLDVDQIAQELDSEANKRRFINMLIQGAAANKNHAYALVREELNRLDPELANLYGTVMSANEVLYWAAPEATFTQVNPEDFPTGGFETFEPDDESSAYVIRARAALFPVLVHEIVKGLYEFLSFNEDDPEETRKYAYREADTLNYEVDSLTIGPAIWRHFNNLMVRLNATDIIARVYRHLVTLPPEQFSALMKEILRESPRGLQYLSKVVDDIRSEMGGKSELESLDLNRPWKKLISD